MNQVDRTRIKICGLTREEDVRDCIRFGADAIGFVFHEKSPRFVDIETATCLRHHIPAFVTVTALFMDETDAWIEEVIEKVKPNLLQFHGSETPETCMRWDSDYVKAIPMGSDLDPVRYAEKYPTALGFLLDSNTAGRQGGSGDTFDWSKIPPDFSSPLILAGGLSPENVAAAITAVRPWAVDVSSGVEVAKGVKDTALLQQFFNEVQRADYDHAN